MGFLVGRPAVYVKHHCQAFAHQGICLGRGDLPCRRKRRQHAYRLWTRLQRSQWRRRVHECLPTKLSQPRTCGQRPHAIPIGENNACTSRGSVFVSGLHQLAARRPTPAGQVTSLILCLGAYVEAIQSALRGIALPLRQFNGAYAPHPCTLGNLLCTLTCVCQSRN